MGQHGKGLKSWRRLCPAILIRIIQLQERAVPIRPGAFAPSTPSRFTEEPLPVHPALVPAVIYDHVTIGSPSIPNEGS